MTTRLAFMSVLAATVALGQGYRGAPPPSTYGSFSGFGRVLFPGTGAPPAPYAPTGHVIFPGGGVLGGNRGTVAPGYRRNRQAPLAQYPVFVGGYYGYGMGFDAPPQIEQPQQEPPQTIVVQQPAAQAAPAPVITINQYFKSDGPAGATTSTQSQASYQGQPGPVQAAEDQRPTIYLIAMKDHTIMPALGYWIEGDTLNYITSQGNKNSISLTLVDRDFSRQLNSERHVEFTL